MRLHSDVQKARVLASTFELRESSCLTAVTTSLFQCTHYESVDCEITSETRDLQTKEFSNRPVFGATYTSTGGEASVSSAMRWRDRTLDGAPHYPGTLAIKRRDSNLSQGRKFKGGCCGSFLGGRCSIHSHTITLSRPSKTIHLRLSIEVGYSRIIRQVEEYGIPFDVRV